MILQWLIVLLVSVCSLVALKLPNYITPCSRSDPNHNACTLASARAAVPKFLKGDRKIGLPSLLPLKYPQSSVLNGNSLKVTLNNLTVYGLDNIDIKELQLSETFDYEARKVKFKSFNTQLDIKANYTIDGRILFIPLQGSGPCKFEFINGTYEYNYEYGIETRNGKKYAKIISARSTCKYDVEKAIFNLQNLFNGNEMLGEQTNRLINENWMLLNEELRPSINDLLTGVHEIVTNVFYQNIPLDELILP
ncbi:hypothetical protein HUJ04_002057 [Dendroctonus ponderosae]|nr:hypothetical protein HUJ04_002057 [Dendroctonus ponderosae]